MIERHVQFNGFEWSGWTIFSVCAVVAALVSIVMMFRYERRLVSSSIGNILITLRIAALIPILPPFLEPVPTRSFHVNQTRPLTLPVG